MGQVNTERFKKWRQRWKEALVHASGGRCQILTCGYSRCINAMEFHHIDPNEKDFGLGTLRSSPTMNDAIEAELLKCIMICSNCHKEIHADLIEIPEEYHRFDRIKYQTYLDAKNENKIDMRNRLNVENFNSAVLKYDTLKDVRIALRCDSRTIKNWYRQQGRTPENLIDDIHRKNLLTSE